MNSGAATATDRRARPGAIAKLRLILLVLEGYVYLLATIGFFAGVIAFLIWGIVGRHALVAIVAVLAGLPLLLLTGAAIRSLFFRLPEPAGLRLTREEAPALFAMLDEVRGRLGFPRINRVVIGRRFNATAVQVPRLALFWPRNTLIIGYPLLLMLSPDQLKAVVAHELGHFFYAHGRISGWVYRTRVSWQRLTAALQERGSVPIFVYWILSGYVPRLAAHSAEIAKQQEFLADRCASAAVGSRVAADTLVAMDVGSQHLEGIYWNKVFECIDDLAEPPHPFTEMRDKLDQLSDNFGTTDVLARLLDDDGGWSDTHPSLRERLLALGETARLPSIRNAPSGDLYLGTSLETVAARLDAAWQAANGTAWRERHAERAQARTRLAELATSKSSAARLESASLLEKLGREDDALATCREVLAADPDHAGAALAAGRLLLNRGEADGALLVDKSMQSDPSLTLDACAILIRYYEDEGRWAEAQRYNARASRYATRQRLDRMAPPSPEAKAEFAI